MVNYELKDNNPKEEQINFVNTIDPEDLSDELYYKDIDEISEALKSVLYGGGKSYKDTATIIDKEPLFADKERFEFGIVIGLNPREAEARELREDFDHVHPLIVLPANKKEDATLYVGDGNRRLKKFRNNPNIKGFYYYRMSGYAFKEDGTKNEEDIERAKKFVYNLQKETLLVSELSNAKWYLILHRRGISDEEIENTDRFNRGYPYPQKRHTANTINSYIKLAKRLDKGNFWGKTGLDILISVGWVTFPIAKQISYMPEEQFEYTIRGVYNKSIGKHHFKKGRELKYSNIRIGIFTSDLNKTEGTESEKIMYAFPSKIAEFCAARKDNRIEDGIRVVNELTDMFYRLISKDR